MSKRLILMGASAGPWCGIREVKQPILVVLGKVDRLEAEIKARDCEIPMLIVVDGPGRYPLHKFSQVLVGRGLEWIRITRSPKGVTCLVVPEEAA